jgi:hypothetical protein
MPVTPDSTLLPSVAAGAGGRLTAFQRALYKLVAGTPLPARWFVGRAPKARELPGRRGHLTLEVVSHCWRYAHLQAYQLSSLAMHPPTGLSVRMTVYYAEEDEVTRSLLAAFGRRDVPGVTWDWRPLPRTALMRRCIGRNDAALRTTADWIWFTDCDLLFAEGCLDALATQLQGRQDPLVYPREEACTELLPANDTDLVREDGLSSLITIDPSRFTPRAISRATGPLQITHGDAARQMGYCQGVHCYLEPAEKWQKAHEDRVFRWTLNSQGTPLDLPGVFRIRHLEKGRYTGTALNTRVRSRIRQLKS